MNTENNNKDKIMSEIFSSIERQNIETDKKFLDQLNVLGSSTEIAFSL